jgi:hypothetical protein
MVSAHRQRGWLGLIGLLIALVLVAVLARTILREYGLAGASATQAKHAKAPANEEEEAATVTPKNALERAHALQDQVRQQAIDEEKRIDAAIPK